MYFYVSGAIDGYSRRIIYLEVNPSNNNPAYIALYYVNAVENLGYCPTSLITDAGTENTTVAALQCYFRRQGQDRFAGLRSHRYVKSTVNQRIECWWALMRKDRIDMWINYFKELCRDGEYDKDSQIQKYCMSYSMMPLLKATCANVADRWNRHRIRTNRTNGNVAGIPNVLYYAAHVRCSQPVSRNDIQFARTKTAQQSRSGCDAFDAFAFDYLTALNRDTETTDRAQAFNNFVLLRDRTRNRLPPNYNIQL